MSHSLPAARRPETGPAGSAPQALIPIGRESSCSYGWGSRRLISGAGFCQGRGEGLALELPVSPPPLCIADRDRESREVRCAGRQGTFLRRHARSPRSSCASQSTFLARRNRRRYRVCRRINPHGTPPLLRGRGRALPAGGGPCRTRRQLAGQPSCAEVPTAGQARDMLRLELRRQGRRSAAALHAYPLALQLGAGPAGGSARPAACRRHRVGKRGSRGSIQQRTNTLKGAGAGRLAPTCVAATLSQ